MTQDDIANHIEALDRKSEHLPPGELQYQQARALWEIALQLARIAEHYTAPQLPESQGSEHPIWPRSFKTSSE